MAGDAEAVVRAVIDAAKGGDMTAAKIILDRIAPPCRGRRVRVNLPPIVGAADLVRALAAVADAMSRGVISAGRGAMLPPLASGFGDAWSWVGLPR